MKDEEKIKPSKKKILTRVLIAAACLLVIAAITLAIVFTVGRPANQLVDSGSGSQNENDNNQDENGGSQNPGGNTGNQGQEQTPGGSQESSSKYEFIVPVKDVNLIRSHEFGYDKTMDWYCLHEGMDFSAAAGTEVYAAVDGTVVEITTKDVDILYGDSVTLEHANGVRTVYTFIDIDPSIKVGTTVNRGQKLGTVAAACGVENADGDHLHFEVFKSGESVDPDEYLNILTK